MYQARITCSVGYPRTDDTYSAHIFPQKAATIRDKLIGLCNYTLTKGKPPERGQLPAKPAYRNVLGDFVQELPIPVNPKGSPNEYFLPSRRLGFGELDGYAKRDALQKGVAEDPTTSIKTIEGSYGHIIGGTTRNPRYGYTLLTHSSGQIMSRMRTIAPSHTT
jgi:hypothetical protein